jgi:uncharacterized membrane protein YbaN (DUF454 family)
MLITHLRNWLRAALPYGLVRRIEKHRAQRAFEKSLEDFRQRNRSENARQFGLSHLLEVPEIPRVLSEYEAVDSLLHAVAFAERCGMLMFLDSTDGARAQDIAGKYHTGLRQTRALLDFMLAGDVLEKISDRYRLKTGLAIYFNPRSPFYIAYKFPPSRFTAELMSENYVSQAVASWQGGTSHAEQNWAMSMHDVSFKLGFALANTNLIQHDHTVVDIAGGAGSVCIALALRHPTVGCTVFELPKSAEVARELVASYGLTKRIKCLGGDMFKDNWPEGHDAVLFTNIFHDWSENDCLTLARKAYQSLRPGGKILLQEALLAEHEPGPLWVAYFSLLMAIDMSGRQYRFSELRDILSEAGFRDIAVAHLMGHYSTVSAVRP